MLLNITRQISRKVEFKVAFTSINLAPNSKLCPGLQDSAQFRDQNLGWFTSLGHWPLSPALSSSDVSLTAKKLKDIRRKVFLAFSYLGPIHLHKVYGNRPPGRKKNRFLF